MKTKLVMWFLRLNMIGVVGLLQAQEVFKDNNTLPLNDVASWVGGAVPGSTNSAVWDATVLGENTVNIGGPLIWDGLRIANPNGAVTINGTDRLTLDGGAAIDVDLSAATRDLTVNTPVTLSGSPVLEVNANRTLSFNDAIIGSLTKNGDGRLVFGGAVNIVNGTYVAGQTVYEGTTSLSGDHRLAGGTVVLRGINTMNAGSTETLAIYKGALVLDGGALTMTNTLSSRFYAGRGDATSDGLLIVSNGTHTILGANNGSMANFIGVSGAKRGRLYMENGSLSVVYLRLGANQKGSEDIDELIINNGVLAVNGTTGSDPMSKAFKMGTRFDESTVDAASRSCLLSINGGRFLVPNGTSQISSDVTASTGTQQIFLNGGLWAAKKIVIGTSPNVARTFIFDGGVLQGTNVTAGAELIDGSSNAVFKVRSRGALLDSAAYEFGFDADLTEDKGSPGGGLVKLGSGRLTLGGKNTYTGATIVSNGLLRLTGTLAVTNLVVEPGAGVSFADGVLSRIAPRNLRIGASGQPSRLEVEVAASGSASDVLVVPSGAWFQQVAVALVQQGTRDPVAREGDFPVLTYTGTAPALANLSWGSPVKGFTCTFELNSATRMIYARLRIAGMSDESVWINSGSGAWATAANWNVMPADAASTAVLFGEIPTAPATVTLGTPFTVGQIAFSNMNAYTLSGAGMLTFNNGASASAIRVDQGSHTVTLPLTLVSPLSVTPASGASLIMSGVIGGSASLVKQGAGDLTLVSNNTYAGGTTLQGGFLALQEGASLGTGPVTLAASGVRLRNTGTGPVTITNDVVVAVSGGALDALAPIVFSGKLDWAPGQVTFYKYGGSELVFKGSANENGNYRINHRTGTFRAAEGANIVINAVARDTIYMAESTSTARNFIVETGAVVVAGGLYTGSGPSNTVYVNGGTLTLTGSGVSGENGLIRLVEDVNGADRIIVDAGTLNFSNDDWLSLGVRGGGAEIIVNGGTATFGRLSLGTRGDTNFSSTGFYTYADVWVNGGVMDVAGALNWMGDIRAGRVNHIYLNGGTLRLPATLRSVALSIANSSEFTLNGGTLELRGLGNFGTTSLNNYLSGLNTLYVDQGGAVIDTLGVSATITQALQRVGSTTGGLTKRGAGMLTLSGACGVAGITSVEAGTLRFASTTAMAGLVLSNSATLSLCNGAFDTLTLSAATLADGARLNLEVATDLASCDRLALPDGAVVGDLIIGLYNVGTDKPVTHANTFTLFTYTGTPPDVSGWKLAPECFGFTCTFVVNTGALTIDAQLAYTDMQVTWANAGAGDWSVAGNWWPQAPASAGALTLFGDALNENAVVNVDGAVSVAEISFNHTYRYTLSGAPVTLSNGVGDATVSVVKGSHTLASPLLLRGGTVASIASGAELKITDVASGAGSLTVEGGGQLTLDGTNATPMTVRGGATVAVPTVASLSGLDLTLDGGGLRVATSDTLGGNVSLGLAGGSLSAGLGQTLLIDARVTGAGGLTKSGAGTVKLGPTADGYVGATTSDGGTLSVTEVPAGALVFGRGTLAFTGSAGSSAQPVIIASGTNAAVLHTDGDLTLSGSFSTLSGAFCKSGTGTVTIAGANTNRIGVSNAANMNGLAASGVDGDGPTTGFGAFNVAQGRVVLGAAGQTNTISGALLIGLNTTAMAGAETPGEMVLAGGVTTCGDWIYVGRNNGTTVTAPGGLASRLLVQAGELNAINLSLGGSSGFSGYTGRPVLEIQGGLCTVQALLYAGETLGGISTIWINGGTLRHLATTATSLRLGNTGGEGILRITAGAADLAVDVILGAGGVGSTGTVELAGGILTARNIYELNAAGTSRVTFDGGVFRPTGGGMSGLDSAKIGAAPAIFDTSLYTGAGYNLAQVLSGVGATDGGFVKAGTNTLIVNTAMAYNGPTIISGGVLRVQGSLPAASALAVAPGARLTLNNSAVKTVTVSGLTLGDAATATPAQLEFGVDSPNKTNDQLVVNGDVIAHHAVFYLYWLNSQTDNIVANGRYALLRWTGAGPGTVNAFSVANPLGGKAYIFTIEGSTLWLTVGAATSGAHVWTATSGGDWSESARWALAPGAGAVGASVRFDESVTAPASVLVNQNTTWGQLYFNSTNAYTLTTGGASVMTVDNGTNAAMVQVEQGQHKVAASLALQGEVDIKPISGTGLTLAGQLTGEGRLVKMNGGELVLSGTNTFLGGVSVASGTLTLTNGATTGAGPLAFDGHGTQMHVSGVVPSVLAHDVALRGSTNVVLNIDAQARLELSGELRYENVAGSTLHKQGAGELTLAGHADSADDNVRLNLQEGLIRLAPGADYRIGNVSRDVVKMDTDNNRGRTFSVEGGAAAALSGIYMAYGTNTVVVDGRLDFTGNLDAACLRIQSNVAEDRFIVRSGGTVTCPQATWFNIGVRGPGVLSVEGGSVQLGSVSLGYQQKPGDNYGGAYGRVFVTGGGLLDVTGKWNWMGDSNNFARVNMLLVGDGLSSGNTVRLPPTTQSRPDGWSSLGLNKGTLVTTGTGLTSPVAGDYLNGLKQIYVGGNGGAFDTASQSITLMQSVCADQAGGTLAKAGAGSLTLAQPLRWDGTVNVQGGTLSAALIAASVRQSQPSNLLARYSFENGPLADTSGSGRHGVQRGATVMSAGTNGLNGLTFDTGSSSVCVPCDTAMRGMDRFTVAMWLWVNSISTSAGTGTTFFTTRKDNASSGPYEFMIRMNNNKIRFMSTGSGTSWVNLPDTTVGIPGSNQWVHVACTVTPGGVTTYINGIQAGSVTTGVATTTLFCPPTRPLNEYGFGFGHYHLAAPQTGQFRGRYDDVRVYSYALSRSEVQALIDTETMPPDLRVAGGAAFVAQGSTNVVRELTGEGSVLGAVTVRDCVAAGDSTNAPAGAVLMADDLTLGTNVVYKWTWSPTANDELLVNKLTIGGAGVVDLGREEGDLITGSFRAVLMSYETIGGAANLVGWKLANVGGKGYRAVIKAENKEVVLEFASTRGTLLWLK